MPKWVERLLLTLFAGGAICLLLPMPHRHPKARWASCLSNLKQINLGLMLYVQDYDERMPPTARWMDTLYPYILNEGLLHCPSLTGRGYGYAFDARLDRFPLEKLTAAEETVALYETTDWAKDATSPGTKFATRHGEHETLGNVAFADGHAKLLTAEAFEKLRPFRKER